ncbi:S41 family peptidase [Croceicoccus mobilis]|uniref:Peptidase S41 n=1 Tax=Croceicoccus mobilis TaxID=1703339 RepID=A0A916YZG2_9SPHN|nr:S41 family peptidase [Croceicoccus mobilis]GGD68375.1 peptidase S41 [Croceicoccus mobilis]
MTLFGNARLAANLTGAIAMTLVASGCGGGGGSGGSGSPVTVTPSPSPTPSPTPTASCSLSARQAWVRDQLEEWYLFPDLLDTSVNAANYNTVQGYIDALTKPAQQQGKDRWTYLTSIEDEEAYYESGLTAGFGILVTLTATNRLYLREAYETAPGYKAGMDRGTEILAIGDSASSLVNVADMSIDELVDILGPSNAGYSKVFQFRTREGTVRTETVTKAEYAIEPLSPRYGAVTLDTASGKIGYINLRTFIEPAEPALRDAFAQFKSDGVADVIVDVRYNGGGLIQTAGVLSSLLNKDHVGEEFTTLELRESKSSLNDTYLFMQQSSAISASRIAFIGTSASASASELIMNAQIPYSGTDTALVGRNTYGKPVGQFAFDLTECDDRLRAVTFRTVNADGSADYYDGMASVMPATCRADDDFYDPLGSTEEGMIAAASGWIAGASCTAIATGGQGALSVGARPLRAANPNIAQIEIPGLF